MLISISIYAQEKNINIEYSLNPHLSELDEKIHFLNPLQKEQIINYVSPLIFPVSSSVIVIDNHKIHIEITNQKLENKNYITLNFIYEDNEKKQLNALITIYHHQQQRPL